MNKEPITPVASLNHYRGMTVTGELLGNPVVGSESGQEYMVLPSGQFIKIYDKASLLSEAKRQRKERWAKSRGR